MRISFSRIGVGLYLAYPRRYSGDDMKNEITIPVFKMSDFEKFSDKDVRTVTKGFSIYARADKMHLQPLIATFADVKRLTIGDDPKFFDLPADGAYACFFVDLANGGLIHTHGGKNCFILAVCKLPKPLTVIKGNSVSTNANQKDKIWLIISIDMGKAANHNRGRSLNNPEKSGGNIIKSMTSTAITTKPRKGAPPPDQLILDVPWFVINSKGKTDFRSPDVEIVFPERTTDSRPSSDSSSRAA